MKSVKITINTENAAFSDAYPEVEVARILAEVAETLTSNWGGGNFPLRDINGNRVGVVEFK